MVSNGLPTILLRETVWLEASKFEEAEKLYHEVAVKERNQKDNSSSGMSKSSLASEIAFARQKIQNFLKSGDMGTVEASAASLLSRVQMLEKEKEEMNQKLEAMCSKMEDLFTKVCGIEETIQSHTDAVKFEKKNGLGDAIQNGPPDDDDDVDLFGSEEETEDDIKLKEERLKAYENKKAKKPALVAKSSVVLDVKPWDDETDMKAMEAAVRKIQADGLVWGASNFVPLAFGIKKLQIVAVVEDEKISVDWLQETIQDIEELVQSVDIAAFNKL